MLEGAECEGSGDVQGAEEMTRWPELIPARRNCRRSTVVAAHAHNLRIHRKQILAPTAANGIRRQNQFADPGNMVPPRESDDAPVRAS